MVSPPSLSVVSVSFAEAEYSITEDDAVVNITISRQGRASIPIEIFITTTSERSSATGTYNDIILLANET